jgi:ABC-type sugar transport system ATPase subunit
VNLEFGLKAKNISKEKRDQLISEILGLVQMNEYRDSKPGDLYGGQQQRVALARALVQHPKALLMDEPLSSLDLELNRHIRQEILRLHETLGFMLIYVTHDREEALDIGTRVVIMQKGRIERSGSTVEIRSYFEQAAKS